MGGEKSKALLIGFFFKERSRNVAVITALLHVNQALKQNIANYWYRLDGGEKFFFGHRKICIGEKFTFYVFFEIKKKFGPYFPIPYTEEHFQCHPLLGGEKPLWIKAKFVIVHLVFFAISWQIGKKPWNWSHLKGIEG